MGAVYHLHSDGGDFSRPKRLYPPCHATATYDAFHTSTYLKVLLVMTTCPPK